MTVHTLPELFVLLNLLFTTLLALAIGGFAILTSCAANAKRERYHQRRRAAAHSPVIHQPRTDR